MYAKCIFVVNPVYMATNKHAIIRYRTIDRCLRDIDRQWTWRELAEACNQEISGTTGKSTQVSERTIKYDISAMRSNEVLGYFAPIDYDRKEKTYYYTDPKYTLTERAINKSDTQLLQSAMSMIEQFMEVKEATGIQNILTKLESSLDRQKKKHDPIIQFDHDVEAPGQKWLYQLYQSIKQKQTATILYQPFGKSKKSRIISPQLLKEYKGRWYLLSYDHQQKASRVYALDRIKNVHSSLSEYVPLEKEENRRYFDQVVGVSVLQDREVETIVFEAMGVQSDYFKTKPLHPSQRLIKQEGDVATFEIKTIINYELLSELMSFHSNVKVISPNHLIDDILGVLQKMSGYYSG